MIEGIARSACDESRLRGRRRSEDLLACALVLGLTIVLDLGHGTCLAGRRAA